MGRKAQILICLVVALSALAPGHPFDAARPQSVPRVELKRVPESGIQPQVAVDANGTVHLIYFKGDALGGDLFYTRSRDGRTFGASIRVNSVPGSAVAIGNIRGGRIAVGRSGHVFVAWNGSQKMGDPKVGRSPLLFSRLNERHTASEPERNLIQLAYGLDGGSGIAADRHGRVFVFWHAPIPGRQGEDSRRVWMTRSEDDGKTFAQERAVWDEPTGVCGCCSLDAHTDSQGQVYVLFRSAQQVVHRDIYLLESDNHGATFRAAGLSKWNVGYCVMSSEAFVTERGATFGAWETEERVHFGRFNRATQRMSDTGVSADGKNQKYPALAMNRSGLLLVSWAEGMGWKRGGSARWQVFDRAGQPVGAPAGQEGVPPWSLVAAYSRTDGTFVVLY